MKTNIQKTKNQFTASMILEKNPEINYWENLNSIGSYFINQFINKNQFLEGVEGEKRKLVEIGFAMVSGNDRANKAIELALATLLVNDRLLYKSVLLLISIDTIELELDEVGIINDYIQEKSDYNADIVMGVNEDKNLGSALAVTIIISD